MCLHKQIHTCTPIHISKSHTHLYTFQNHIQTYTHFKIAYIFSVRCLHMQIHTYMMYMLRESTYSFLIQTHTHVNALKKHTYTFMRIHMRRPDKFVTGAFILQLDRTYICIYVYIYMCVCV